MSFDFDPALRDNFASYDTLYSPSRGFSPPRACDSPNDSLTQLFQNTTAPLSPFAGSSTQLPPFSPSYLPANDSADVNFSISDSGLASSALSPFASVQPDGFDPDLQFSVAAAAAPVLTPSLSPRFAASSQPDVVFAIAVEVPPVPARVLRTSASSTSPSSTATEASPSPAPTPTASLFSPTLISSSSLLPVSDPRRAPQPRICNNNTAMKHEDSRVSTYCDVFQANWLKKYSTEELSDTEKRLEIIQTTATECGTTWLTVSTAIYLQFFNIADGVTSWSFN